ncbi:polymer-forming cytoskeletal protein [Prosthecobacter sp. SYSU 5D2]|uniref:bactofilin family protein n=1 Tax=Prosthecobacter sp. SYSU 5D2 TaxID=3134134 RepID=UPI0031FEFF46
MPDPWADAKPAAKPEPPVSRPAPKPAASALQPISDPIAAELAQPVSEEEAEEGGFGVFLKQQGKTPPAGAPASPSEPAPPAQEAAPDPESEAVSSGDTAAEPEDSEREAPPVAAPSYRRSRPAPYQANAAEAAAGTEKRAQSNSPPPTAAPAPMSASTLQKMKSEGMYRNQYFKDADCFECDHSFKVSRSTRSTQCPNCGATIALEDVEVNMPSGDSIKTRGDVLIRKRGQVSAESIICKDLRCQGILEANVKASGDAIFRANGNMIGQVHCRRLIIEKGCDVVFINEVYAEEVEIHARITGTIISSGSFLIGPNGCVNGDITARSVSIEPGGELNGGMNIVRK